MLRPGEFRAVSLWAALLVVLILLPYVVAGVLAGAGSHFMGHLHAVDEGNAYLAWSRQAAEGAWRLQNKYTAIPDEGLFFSAFFVGIGKAAALLHVEPIVVYHLARPICGWLCLVSVYLLAAFFFPDAFRRWTVLALAAGSSGLGWVVHLIRARTDLHPLDFGDGLIQPEAITFLCIYVTPLFALSVALMCLVFLTFLLGVHRGRDGWLIASGLLNLLLGNIHTYDIIIVNGALAIYLALMLATRAIRLSHAAYAYGLLLAISAWSPLYQAYVIAADPLYAAKAMTPTRSAPVVDHALTYGLVLLLGLAGAATVARRPDTRTSFLLAWLVLGALMPFAPADVFPFQRKMWEGFHVVLCLLAGVACAEVVIPWLSGRRSGDRTAPASAVETGVVAAIVILTVPSNLFFVNLTMRDARDNNRRLIEHLMPPIYLTDDEVASLRWLRDNTDRDDVVMSAPFIGSYIPAVSGNRVYMGHWAETLWYKKAASVVAKFYSSDTDEYWREALLRRMRARYVYYGQYERGISEDVWRDFLEAPGLAPACQSGNVMIFRVRAWPGDGD